MTIKRLGTIILLGLFLSSCGDDGASTTGSSNLFLDSRFQEQQNQPNTSMMGLWESEEYVVDGISNTLRWHLTESRTTLAKRCVDENGHTWYAQVFVDLDQNAVIQQSNSLTPYNLPTSTSTKVSQVKLMSQNRPCRVSIDPNNASTDTIFASGSSQFAISADNFASGEMELTTQGTPSLIRLVKIQDHTLAF